MNRITLLLCCILCANSVHAEPVTLPDDLFPTNIWVNGVDRKSEVLLLTENNLYYVECQDLEKLQLNMGLFKHHSVKNSFCLVSDNDIQTEFDSGLQAIKLTLPAKFFAGSADEDSIAQPMKANFGAFLNYDLNYEKNKQDENFGALPELGVFKDNWILRNNAVYRNNKGFDFEGSPFLHIVSEPVHPSGIKGEEAQRE